MMEASAEESGLEVRPARKDEYGAIGELIAQTNTRPETQCLHSDDRAEIAAPRLAEMAATTDGRVIVATKHGAIVGAFAADVDEALGRAWLWGPFWDAAGDGVAEADRLAGRMLTLLTASIPETVTLLDAFPNERNALALRFYLPHGFAERERHHVYVAERTAVPAPEGVIEVLGSFAASAAPLHQVEFPTTYWSWEDLVAKSGGAHRLFVVLAGDQPESSATGYLFAERFEEDGEGYIHYLAVSPEDRGRGVGQLLMTAALHWLFEVEASPRVNLTVTADRVAAQRLYERNGFRRSVTGVALRWDRSAVPTRSS